MTDSRMYGSTDVEDAANTLRWSEVKEAATESPKHYGSNWAVADFIRDQGLDFLSANVVKYLCRAPHKGTEVQDLRKAIHYLEKRIADLTKDSLNNTDK